MRLGKRVFIMRVALGVTLGAAVGSARAQSAAEAGKPLYERRCALCHGTDGSPQANVANMLMAEIPHLGSPRVQARSAAELQKIIKEGSGKMKAIKGIADADIASIIAYVKKFKKP